VATVEQCEAALHELADRLANAEPHHRSRADVDRTLSCTVRDLDVSFAGQLKDGRLVDIHRADTAKAQVRLTMTSDDLLRLVAGELNMASAWASGRVKIDAGIRDLLRLRNLF
jgi:predicted lipid carrier protein YhbT